jgi:DNA-binding NarL/FixJ family response regulator
VTTASATAIPLLLAGAGKLPHVRVVAFVADLMDRSRLTGPLPDVTFASDPASAHDADVVVVDLARFASLVATLRAESPTARIVAFGAHVDTSALDQALVDGADVALPRSQFFRDPAAAMSDVI